MPALTVTLLGEFGLRKADGAAVALPGQKDRALLALLSIPLGVHQTRDRLSGLLWSDNGDTRARDSLKHAIARLRQALESAGVAAIRSDRNTVMLDPSGLRVDVTEFEACASAGSPSKDRAALEHYAGELLAGVAIQDPAFEEWLLLQRQRLQHLAETTATRLLREAQASGDMELTGYAARRLLALDPFREDACQALMILHRERGETAQALRLFASLRDRLHHDLGVRPEAETLRLAESFRSTRHPDRPALRLVPDRPSIAVLPFSNASGDPGQDYLAEGIAEDILTALSQYRWFTVVARNSSFALSHKGLEPDQIARLLGVRYIVGGSVRRAGPRIRISSQLVETEAGSTLWAARYDCDTTEILSIQDELIHQVVGALEPEILMGESRRALARPTVNPDAYDCHMRGIWHHNQQDRAEDFAEAILWQRRAIEIDPTFGRAYIVLARALYARCLFGYSRDIAADSAELSAAAARAVALENGDAYAHYASSLAHLLAARPAAALAAAERATLTNPSLALAHNAVGWARIFTGRFADALGPLEAAMRLSPHDPLTYLFLSRIGLAQYHLGNYDAAVDCSWQALSLRRRHFIMVVLLAGLGRLGRMEEARTLSVEMAAIAPKDRDRYWQMLTPYADARHRADLFEGLHKAGLR